MGKRQYVESTMSEVREQTGSSGIQANPLALTNVWHTQSFMRSLQLVIYQIRTSRNGAKTKQEIDLPLAEFTH